MKLTLKHIYEERILRDIQNGITLEKLDMKKRKKTPEEKAAVLKMKRKQRIAKRQVMKNHAVENNTSQDDIFFFLFPKPLVSLLYILQDIFFLYCRIYFWWSTIWSNMGRSGTGTLAGFRRGAIRCT